VGVLAIYLFSTATKEYVQAMKALCNLSAK
jgi:hypothetical protein